MSWTEKRPEETTQEWINRINLHVMEKYSDLFNDEESQKAKKILRKRVNK